MKSEFARVRALVFEPYTLFRVPAMTGQIVNVSQHGFRLGGKADAWPPDPAAANIFVFGGSTTFGLDVADVETIPAQLAEQLTQSASGQRVTVYNFATPNYSSVQERIQLEQLMLDGHVPRVAIFIDGFDEFIAPYYAPMMHQAFIDAVRRRPRLTRILDLLRPAAADESRCRLPEPANVLDRYFSNMRLIKAICREFGTRPLFVWQPVPCYEYEGPVAGEHGSAAPLVDCVRRGYELMKQRPEFVSDDFHLTLADIQRGRSDSLYVDADHYTPAFCGEIAARIKEHIVNRDLLRR